MSKLINTISTKEDVTGEVSSLQKDIRVTQTIFLDGCSFLPCLKLQYLRQCYGTVLNSKSVTVYSTPRV